MTVHKKHIVPTEGEKLKFEIKDNMVDVTYLGLPFGENKHPLAWLQTREASQVAAMIAFIRKCNPKELVRIEGKDDDPRIWFDIRLALCYIGWVFPPFKQWFVDKIDEIEKRLMKNVHQRRTDEDKDESHGILIAFHRPGDKPC